MSKPLRETGAAFCLHNAGTLAGSRQHRRTGMADEFQFDVFLSHSAKDKAVVRPLAERLRQDGLKVWFDEWECPSPAGAGEGLRPSDGRKWRSRMREDTWPGEGRGENPTASRRRSRPGWSTPHSDFSLQHLAFSLCPAPR